MRVIANEPIKVLPLPNRTFPADCLVDRVRGIRFPRVHDASQPILSFDVQQRVHMVWHDAPSQQSVAFRIEMEQRTLHDVGGARIVKKSITMHAVENAIGRLASGV